MKKHFKKLTSVMLALSLAVTMLPIYGISSTVSAATHTLQNPSKNSSGDTVWDCVWFGSYPQAEVIPSGKYTALDSNLLQDGDTIISDSLYNQLESAAGWSANGDITISGNKYRRIQKPDATYTSSLSYYYYNWSDSTTYHYFKYEPIKWRVLNVNGNDAFLLADKGLDDQRYNTSKTNVTWKTATIRSWLNGYSASSNAYGTDYTGKNFLDTAFGSSEQSAIKTTAAINDDNIYFGTNGGNNTNDKIFLLSESEVYTDSATSYGFDSDDNEYDKARRSKSSTYCKAMGTYSDKSSAWRGNCDWWLRSPGNYTYNATNVNYYGDVYWFGDVDLYTFAVRPALHLNLSSSNLYSYAGTVCSDGTENVEGGGIPIKPGDDISSSDINASIYTMEEWKQWLDTSGKMINYLSIPENFYHVMYISNNDHSVFGHFEYLFTNFINVGEGWRELLKEDKSEEDAEKILYALLSESEDSIKQLSQANTAKKWCSQISDVFRKYLLSEAYDQYTVNNLSDYMKTEEFETIMTQKGYDSAIEFLLTKVDSTTANKLKETMSNFKVSNDLKNCLKGFGIGLDILDLTKVSVDEYFRYMEVKEANDFYFELLQYISDNAEVQCVCDAATRLYTRGQNTVSQIMAGVASDIAASKGVDYVLDKVIDKVWFLAAAKGGMSAGKLLANKFFHTMDTANLKSSMRVTAYIGQAVAEWTNNKYSSVKSNLTFDNAEAVMYGVESLTKIRKMGETSLKNLAPNIKDKRGEQIACATISTLDSYLEHIALLEQEYNFQTLKVSCPVDVDVYNASGKLVLTVEDGKESSGNVDGISYYVYYSRSLDDYTKVIVAPKDKGYTFKVRGVDLGKVSCSVSNINSDGISNISSFENLDVDTNREINIFPDLDNDISYEIYDNDELIDSETFVIDDIQESVPVTGLDTKGVSEITLKIGEKRLLSYSVIPENAINKYINWSSNNMSIATVNEDGVISAVSKGTAIITAESEDGGYLKTCVVNVENIDNTTEDVTGSEEETTKDNTVNTSSNNLSDGNVITTTNSSSDNSVVTTNSTEESNVVTATGEKEKAVVKNSKTTKIKKIIKKKKSLKVTWKKKSGINGYQLQYSTSQKFKKAKKIVIKNAKITTKTIKKLKAKKKYYVRIRTYIMVNGKKKYSSWSKVKSLKTK